MGGWVSDYIERVCGQDVTHENFMFAERRVGNFYMVSNGSSIWKISCDFVRLVQRAHG